MQTIHAQTETEQTVTEQTATTEPVKAQTISKTDKAAARVLVTQAAASLARQEFIDTLPVATSEELEYERKLILSTQPEGKSKINSAYRVTETQAALLAYAKAQRKELINTDASRKEISATVKKIKTFTSFKLKQGKTGVSVSISGML